MSEQTKTGPSEPFYAPYLDPWEKEYGDLVGKEGLRAGWVDVELFQTMWRAGYTWDVYNYGMGGPTKRYVGKFLNHTEAQKAYETDQKSPPKSKIDLGLNGGTYVNEKGGRQTELPHRLDLLPMTSLLAVGRVLGRGAKKYGEDNWHNTTVRENLNHALGHMAAYLLGDQTEPHLSHFATRALMALFLEVRDRDTLEV